MRLHNDRSYIAACEPRRYMMMNEQSKREKLVAKILYWSLVVPTTFGVFFRIFFIFFNFVYGLLIVKIIGQDYAGPVL